MERPDGSVLRRTLLPGGLRVISESVPGMRSASLGVWVGVGSRDETRAQTGAAHYLEHLLFKGTPTRSAWEISAAVDAVGGELNAFTTKEYTCFYARVLGVDLPLATDVVCDVVLRGSMRAADVEAERGVILEEIAMNEDDPADLVHDLAARQVYGDSGLGRPILGTVESIEALTRANIASFHRRRYSPDAMVVAAAGAVDHRALVRQIRRAFGDRLAGAAAPAPVRAGRPRRLSAAGSTVVHSRATEQAHVVMTLPGVHRRDPRRYAVAVLNAVLGGGMSSRLFSAVREERGLAYAVYSYVTQYSDVGSLGVYAGCLPSKVDEVVAVTRDVLHRVASDGLTPGEVARGKGQVRGSIVLGQEDAAARMSRAGKAELLYGEFPSVDDILADIDAVSVEDVRLLAGQLLGGEPALAVVGPFDEDRAFAR